MISSLCLSLSVSVRGSVRGKVRAEEDRVRPTLTAKKTLRSFLVYLKERES